ncbi:MAG: hypothetical protein ABFS14_02905 [Gemmatimonadota bacterium]
MERIAHIFQGKLSRTSRLLILAVAIALIPSVILPVWKITLHAPQYPAGLEMVIYPNTVGGDLDEVNLLNHYIGMQHIDADEFPEFKFIPFFILRLLGFATLAVLVGRVSVAAIGYLDFMLFGVVMLFDFQGWLAQYGTNLSPAAAISMEPFIPKFLGTTEIANFTVTSWPASGAILMAIAGFLGPVILAIEWKNIGRAAQT